MILMNPIGSLRKPKIASCRLFLGSVKKNHDSSLIGGASQVPSIGFIRNIGPLYSL